MPISRHWTRFSPETRGRSCVPPIFSLPVCMSNVSNENTLTSEQTRTHRHTRAYTQRCAKRPDILDMDALPVDFGPSAVLTGGPVSTILTAPLDTLDMGDGVGVVWCRSRLLSWVSVVLIRVADRWPPTPEDVEQDRLPVTVDLSILREKRRLQAPWPGVAAFLGGLGLSTASCASPRSRSPERRLRTTTPAVAPFA